MIAAEGRNEASRVLRARIAEEDQKLAELSALLRSQEVIMRDAVDRRRSAEISEYFRFQLSRYAAQLDVRVGSDHKGRLSSIHIGRGSEGPRGIIAYYYAFLQTARQYSTSSFCPIVIDAPNQQGQDREHMPQIMQFIVNERPEGSQVILASEELFGVENVSVVDVGVSKNRVLREDLYDQVYEHLRPYLGNLL